MPTTSFTWMWTPGSEPWNLASPKVKKPSVGAHEVVALAVGGGGDGHDVRNVLAESGQVAVELGVTEGADGAVGRDYPVALGVGGGGNAHYSARGGRGRYAAERWRRTIAVDRPLAVASQYPAAGRLTTSL